MHPTHVRPLEDSGSPAFACGNAQTFPSLDVGPCDLDAGIPDVGDNSPWGWGSAWIDLGGEG